jgi:hypothetical protein
MVNGFYVGKRGLTKLLMKWDWEECPRAYENSIFPSEKSRLTRFGGLSLFSRFADRPRLFATAQSDISPSHPECNEDLRRC